MNTLKARAQGFTLIEMMIVIVIAAILFSIGVPSFTDLITRNKVESLQVKLSSAVAAARSEAASRNSVVTMCPSNDAASCSGSWKDGWIIYEDHDADGVFDSTEILIDVYEHSGNYTLKATDSGNNTASRISFSSQGYMQGTEPALFTICEPDNELRYARGIFVNASGLMIKTVDGADADTNHDNPFRAADADPTDLACS